MVNRAKRPDRRHLLAAAHPTRRDGAIALVTFLLPWVAAVILVRRHHHLDGGAVGILVAVSLGLPTLWVAWAAYRGPRHADTSASGLSMAQVADQLAVAVGTQWTDEAAMRRLNDPYPLPVSWAAADASLTDSWDSLVKLATSGAGWPPPPKRPWVRGPAGLAGKGSKLVDVLARVPTGRLVVLGEPGAGKTMLMVRLVLDLLARRAEGAPVPFLASVASWNPAAQDLRGWLGAQLVINHPALASPPPPGREEPTRAAALLAAGLILPVMDGLDEIPEQVRGPAISRINDAVRPGEQVVVACRTQQYRDAVRPQSGIEVTLRATAAIQLRPLNDDAVRSYLCDDAAGPVTRARWAPVLAVLGTKAPAGQALATPLMVGLARAIYNPRLAEPTGTLPDPAELCSPALADRAAVESVLFDAFIPAAYRHDPASRWKAQDAQRQLVFLARHLERTIGGPDLAWWHLPLAVPRAVAGRVVGSAIGIVVGVVTGAVAWHTSGLAGVVAGLASGIGAGVGAGLITTRAGGVTRGSRPSRGLRFSKAGLMTGAVFAIACGIGGAIPSDGHAPMLASGVLIAVGAGLVLAPATGLRTVPGDLAAAVTPRTVLARDRCATLIKDSIVVPVALVMGGSGAVLALILPLVPFGVGSRPGVRVPLAGVALAAVLAGLTFGLIGEYIFSVLGGAWPSYAFARGLLALRRQLPWKLMDFLEDAHRRGILRQAGAVYQFRHIELQHRLANRDADKQQANSSTA